MSALLRTVALVAILAATGVARAQDMLLVRAPTDFATTLEAAKRAIEARGYRVAHVQRCDAGLTHMGYQTDKYRIIFFGKLDEVRALSDRQPDLAVFLPLRLAVFAENGDTLLAMLNPSALTGFFPDPAVNVQLRRWENDVRAILDEVAGRD